MQVFSIVLFILLSVILFVYVCLSTYLKIKQNRKYRDKVKGLKGTDYLSRKEKYTYAKFMTILESQVREKQEKQEKDNKESK